MKKVENKKEKKVEPTEPKVETPKEEKKAPKLSVSSLKFLLANGTSRVYTEEEHGEDFEELANSFATKQAKYIISRINE